MAIREYKCNKCGVVTEVLLPTEKIPDPTAPCAKCGEGADYQPFSRTGLLTDNFSHQKIDVAIGRDAARRWEDISQRQQQRDAVRTETGQIGLSMVGRNAFAPLAEEKKVTRTEVAQAIEKGGFKASSETQ